MNIPSEEVVHVGQLIVCENPHHVCSYDTVASTARKEYCAREVWDVASCRLVVEIGLQCSIRVLDNQQIEEWDLRIVKRDCEM